MPAVAERPHYPQLRVEGSVFNLESATYEESQRVLMVVAALPEGDAATFRHFLSKGDFLHHFLVDLGEGQQLIVSGNALVTESEVGKFNANGIATLHATLEILETPRKVGTWSAKA